MLNSHNMHSSYEFDDIVLYVHTFQKLIVRDLFSILSTIVNKENL